MRNKIIIAIICLAVVGGVLFFVLKDKKPEQNPLQFTKAEKGDLRVLVSCTGTIEAEKTVQVGSQVSGTIAKMYADFNDKVKAGQILAVLDTRMLEISVKSAQAELLKAESQYQLNVREYENNAVLNQNNLISDFDLEKLKVARESANAMRMSAEANLLRAKTNLEYAVIRCPIDGIVLERNVEEGQTIAASFSAPTLYSIAGDLSNIEIQAMVAESDIGQISQGRKAEFTVSAYPDEKFEGTITRIQLKPVVVSNVVNYTVIVKAKNRDDLLLPGMTATIDIVVKEKRNVVKVLNSSLRFRPTDDMLKKYKNSDKVKTGKNVKNGREKEKNSAVLWYISQGELKQLKVTTGTSDGKYTEIFTDTDISKIEFLSGTVSQAKKKAEGNHGPRMM